MKIVGDWGFAQPHLMADAIYPFGRAMKGVDQFVVVIKPTGVSRQ